jgi:hypothetical protein
MSTADNRPHPIPVDDVVIRAALVTGATVRIAPADAAELPADGVPAVLRYR